MAIRSCLTIIFLAGGLGSTGCGAAPPAKTPAEPAQTKKTVTIEEAQKMLTDELMKHEGVAGTGIGLCGDHPCIKVYLVRKVEELTRQIPKTFQGYPVTVEVSGEVTARPPRFD